MGRRTLFYRDMTMMHALILIDFQKGFERGAYWGGCRNNPDAEMQALRLLKQWRVWEWPVVFVQHSSQQIDSPLHPSDSGYALKTGFEPIDGEKRIVKHENSAFIGTDLEVWLRRQQVDKLVIAGISTEHCVSTTMRMAGNLGFDALLVNDACHAWPRQDEKGFIDADVIHRVELAILDGEFGEVIDTEEVFRRLA